ncbi:UPF0172-domain-containing protein [Meira miltonrushii]|uniref:UPF0172-domain-containing protein n=1 Tax=Meira miltonrushii TaxID=1280837 RepID=A0A316VJ12_9BASI|nr:UPF0172-domain-containing protein [Meira miltonrushii]PWN37214.1 UPF0172-domain-containing protein [Meira miltonrushii]
MSNSVKVSQTAYNTILLHCAKYPASATTGILIGTSGNEGTLVVSAIPLQHHWNQLSPMVEVGLSLIQAHLSSEASSSTRIVGVYYAPNDVISSTKPELNPLPLKIAQTISTKIGTDSIALQINNAKLSNSSKTDMHALSAYSVSAFTAQPKPISAQNAVKVGDGNSSATTLAKAEIAKGKWQDIVDFDDHLEDTSRDWLKTVAA